jgi:glycosyltransferase involved in cell wall biosynthesis
MHVAFIDGGYPVPEKAGGDTFVQQFVHAMARQGHECSVIAPVSVCNVASFPLPARFATEAISDGKPVEVYRPRQLSFSSRKLGCIHTGSWSNAMSIHAALREMGRVRWRPDIVYGHFMYPAGYAAVRAGKKLGVPSVVGVGEGEFWTLEPVGDQRAARQMRDASVFLAVSTSIAEALTDRLAIPAAKIEVFPNGVDLGAFHPSADQAALRERLGMDRDQFYIGYVGPLIAQKGFPQLRVAVDGLEGTKLVVLGGDASRSDQYIAFSGKVEHKVVADYLGACDIFVLPTAIEGSCNSVIEAMACGLPIVTSNGRYMNDIVDDEVALRVDPSDPRAIREAIVALRGDPAKCRRMSLACLRRAQRFDINDRARRVTIWMQDVRGGITGTDVATGL